MELLKLIKLFGAIKNFKTNYIISIHESFGKYYSSQRFIILQKSPRTPIANQLNNCTYLNKSLIITNLLMDTFTVIRDEMVMTAYESLNVYSLTQSMSGII